MEPVNEKINNNNTKENTIQWRFPLADKDSRGTNYR